MGKASSLKTCLLNAVGETLSSVCGGRWVQSRLVEMDQDANVVKTYRFVRMLKRFKKSLNRDLVDYLLLFHWITKVNINIRKGNLSLFFILKFIQQIFLEHLMNAFQALF